VVQARRMWRAVRCSADSAIRSQMIVFGRRVHHGVA
jgi:hypothetical protein